jgi:hypothetical protein
MAYSKRETATLILAALLTNKDNKAEPEKALVIEAIQYTDFLFSEFDRQRSSGWKQEPKTPQA